MYRVISDQPDMIFTRRRDSFSAARKAARVHGWAIWEDAFKFEPSISFRNVRGRVVVCRCTAETQLMRAIFGDSHPDACSI